MTNTTEQRKIDDFIRREVGHCVSQLVHELTEKAEHFPEYEEDIYGAHTGPVDYDLAAEEAGWEPYVDKYGANCWRDTADGETWCGAAVDLCEEFGIEADDYRQEVLEHWIVSDALARRLEEKGECVLRDFFGLTIWGRTTSGQAISLDSVIVGIYRDLQD